MSYHLFCAHPPSTTIVSSHCGSGSSQTPSFNSSHSCLAAHFLKQTVLACCRSISLRAAADHSHVHRHLLLKQLGVPPRPRDAKIESLAHGCSCRSSHLSPCLYFVDLLPPSLQLLSSSSFQPDTFRPSKRGLCRKFFSTSRQMARGPSSHRLRGG